MPEYSFLLIGAFVIFTNAISFYLGYFCGKHGIGED